MNVNPLGEGTISVVVQQSQGNPSGGSADLDFAERRPPRFLSPRGLTGANIRGACPFIAVFPVYSTTSVVMICSQYVYVVLIREETRINGQAPSTGVPRLLQRIRRPTLLTATDAVTHLEAMHVTSEPFWFHHRLGWLFASGEGALGFQAIDLVRPTNDGKTWQSVSPTTYHESFPTANSMAGGPILGCATPQQGWIAQVNGNRSDTATYGTNNGGKS